MKKILTIAGALMASGQFVGRFDPLIGDMFGLLGWAVILGSFVAVLFVAMAEGGF